MLHVLGFLGLLAATLSTASPVEKRAIAGPVISDNFPDPGLIRISDGRWFAYSTSSSYGRVPYATRNDFKTWTRGGDAMPDAPSGLDPNDGGIWAPDVREMGPNDFRLFYSVKLASQGKRCIGVAVASRPEGPFTTRTANLACNDGGGGLIDPASFLAPGGPMYLLWKVDGNSIGSSSTPIQIQQLAADGLTLTGQVNTLIDRDSNDGPLVEAPSLIYWQGIYYLFFSSNTYSTPLYDVSYAVAKSARGPYVKMHAPFAPLLTSQNTGLTGPGHPGVVNVLDQYVNMVFAAIIDGDIKNGRAMYTAERLCLRNGIVTLDC